jgi:hypothetical protein
MSRKSAVTIPQQWVCYPSKIKRPLRPAPRSPLRGLFLTSARRADVFVLAFGKVSGAPTSTLAGVADRPSGGRAHPLGWSDPGLAGGI